MVRKHVLATVSIVEELIDPASTFAKGAGVVFRDRKITLNLASHARHGPRQ
jgi:hypothetical protein